MSYNLKIGGIPAEEYFKDKPLNYEKHLENVTKNQGAEWLRDKVGYDSSTDDLVYILQSQLACYNPYFKPKEYFDSLGLEIKSITPGTGWCGYLVGKKHE